MAWNLDEAMEYYKKQGAPGEQIALVGLLSEVQEEHGAIPGWILPQISAFYKIKEPFLLALIRRMPRLRLQDSHCLELCSGPNCGRSPLAAFVEKTYGTKPKNFTLKYTGCMRMCGKGPNIRWDGRVYNGADEDLIRTLVGSIEK